MSAADLITLAARPHPFRVERTVEVVPHGISYVDLVARALPDARWREHALVAVDGLEVPRERWEDRPPAGAHVAVTIRLGSGDVLRSVLMLAAVVAAGAVAPYLVGAAGITTAAGWSAVGVSAATAATTAALSTAAMLALNALVPPATSQLGGGGRRAQIWSLERAANDARLWSAIPRVLGRHRYTPPLAADVVPEGDGAESWLRLALCWGYGPVQVSDLRVGETPLVEVPGCEVETFTGTPGQLPSLTIYADDVAVERVDAAVTVEGGPVVRRSAPGADEIVVQLAFPRGLYSLARGERETIAVRYRVETAPVGGAWSTLVEQEVRKASTQPIRISHRTTVSGQVDVRVTRITRDRKDLAKIDDLVLASLLTIKRGNPFRASGVAITALRVPAGEQANGVLGALNGVVESVVLDWDGAAWVSRASRNPAALARAVLQGGGAARPVPDERLDLEAFAAWHDYCRERGLTCDLVVDWDGATVGEVLRLVAACGDALVLPLDGRWTPIIDREQATAVQVLTPRTAGDLVCRRARPDPVHGLRVRFVDAEAGYRQAERVVYADGWSADTATLLDELELPGVTDAALAYRHGRRRLAERLLRLETYAVDLDVEHLACRIGDRVEIAHDAILAALGWARIVAVEVTAGGDVTALAVDQPITLTADVAYGVTVRRPAGISTWPLAAITSTGPTDTLVLASPIPSGSAPSRGDLVVVGERGIETIPAVVSRIRPGPDLTATVEAVVYHAAIYAADTEPIPPWTPRIGASALALPPVIRSARREAATGDVVVELGPAGGLALAGLELAWSVAGGPQQQSSWPSETRLARLTAPADGVVSVQARYRLTSGQATAWSAAAVVEVPTIADVPAAWRDGDELVWRSVADAVGYRVRYGPPGVEWAAAVAAHDGLLTGTRWSARNLPIDDAELLLVAVGAGGAISATPRRIGWARRGETVAIWPIVIRAEHELGWPGRVLDGMREGSTISGSRLSDALWPDPAAIAWPVSTDPAFPDVPAAASWEYLTSWSIPEAGEIAEQAIEVTAADLVEIRPGVLGAVYSTEYAWERAYDEQPWADGRDWEDGRGWAAVAASSWLPWPRQLHAAPGRTLWARLRGRGTLRSLELVVGRKRRSVLAGSVAVPPTGVTIPAPTDGIVVAVQATTETAGVVVRGTALGAGGALIDAVGLDGAAIAAVASVRLEVV